MKKQFNYYKILFFFFGLGIFTNASAQEVTVTGTVTDAEADEPLPGVTVVIKGTQQGAVTTPEGVYTIEAEQGDVLEFSFVGFRSEEVTVGEDETIDVALRPDVMGLDEVVVIGYGQVRKDDATGSVNSINTEDISQGSAVSADDLLNGRTSGVQITSSGGAPGAGSTIRIRGGSSLSASNDPLIVIDGVPVDNDGISGMSNPLSSINPNDIESFNILKDASATAIYGSRASNGVIMITTKSGKKGDEVKFNYHGYVTLNSIDEKVDVLSADEFRDFVADKDPGGVDALGDANTDWQEQIFRNSMGQDHTFSATGAYKNIPFRASVGYTNEDGIIKTSNFERTTASLRTNPSFFEDHLKLNFNLKGVQNNNQFVDNGVIGNAITFDPTQPTHRDDDRFDGYFTWMSGDNPNTVAVPNPLSQLYNRDDESTAKRAIGNLQLDYTFHFLPELSANLNLGFDYSDSEGSTVVDENSNFSWTALDRRDGSWGDYTQEKKNELVDFYLNYATDLDDLSSRVDLMLGYSEQHFWRKDFYRETSYDGSTVYSDSPADESENNLRSYFGRLNYTLLDKYLLTFTLRHDGTSRFHEDTRWGTFPSAALAWRLTEEPFLSEAETLSNLKLRLGYGVTGQQNINQGNYPYLARYTAGTNTAQYQMGDSFQTTLRPEGYNKDLKWEETTTYNIGLDYGFFNNRLSGAIEAYYRETKDLLNVIPVSAGTNFTNQLLTNVGDLENRGVELTVDGHPISRDDFSWKIGFNATYSETEIQKLTLSDNPGYKGVYVGGISGGTGNTAQIHSVGHSPNAFYVYEQVYDEEGNPIDGLYADRDGDGEVTGDDRYQLEKPSPDVFMGLNSSLKYNNFDFSFSARANVGNYVYNNVFSSYGFSANVWENGFLSNVVRDATKSNFRNARYLSDYYVKNASFLRMDNISLGYTFDNMGYLGNFMGEDVSARVYGTVENAFVITEYEGLDPEVENGIDSNVYPRPRVFMFGVNVNF
ncbi:MAG: TonB-dependent receptor [Marinilabilia sp.]